MHHTSPPRPIIKRSPRKAHHAVHFPPSPVLTRACLAHSPNSYDRTPIQVEENQCALPERGCPGRTYDITDTDESVNAIEQLNAASITGSGRTIHPRVLQSQATSTWPVSASSSGHTEYPYASFAIPATTGLHVPSLVPDISSSSETDESDGLSSPPLEYASFAHTPSSKIGGLARTSLPSEDIQRNLASALSFLPHAPQGSKPRRRRDSKSKLSVASASNSSSDCTGDEDTVDEGTFAAMNISARLSAGGLTGGDEGCLGGF
jgi:hypothetical protein